MIREAKCFAPFRVFYGDRMIMMSSVIIHKLKEWVEINPLRSKIKKQAAIARQNKMKKILEDPKKIRSAAQGAVRRQQKLAGIR